MSKDAAAAVAVGRGARSLMPLVLCADTANQNASILFSNFRDISGYTYNLEASGN